MLFQDGPLVEAQGTAVPVLPGRVMAVEPLLAVGHWTPNACCQFLVASTTRASICTCWICTSSWAMRSSIRGRLRGRSVMMSVLVRSSMMRLPRLVRTLSRIALASVALAKESGRVMLWVSPARALASSRRLRSSSSFCSFSTLATRMMPLLISLPRPACLRITSSTWSQGVSVNLKV